MKPCASALLITGSFLGVALSGFVAGQFWNGTNGMPAISIDATASAIGEDFSMATGQVSADAEGVFVLDHNSGLLQCNVLYPRTGQFGAAFVANVKDALGGGGKNSKYLMVTGAAQFGGNASRGAANCVVYVLDQSSGAYACLGIPFSESLVNGRTPQMGPMTIISIGQAKVALDRDAMR
jgi:hypothetical protein